MLLQILSWLTFALLFVAYPLTRTVRILKVKQSVHAKTWLRYWSLFAILYLIDPLLGWIPFVSVFGNGLLALTMFAGKRAEVADRLFLLCYDRLSEAATASGAPQYLSAKIQTALEMRDEYPRFAIVFDVIESIVQANTEVLKKPE